MSYVLSRSALSLDHLVGVSSSWGSLAACGFSTGRGVDDLLAGVRPFELDAQGVLTIRHHFSFTERVGHRRSEGLDNFNGDRFVGLGHVDVEILHEHTAGIEEKA